MGPFKLFLKTETKQKNWALTCKSETNSLVLNLYFSENTTINMAL